MSDLIPEGWKESSIGEITSKNSLFSDGDWVESKDQDPLGTNRLIQLADIGDGVFINKSSRYMNDEQFKRIKCTALKKNDILIARMPEPLGRACLYPLESGKAATVVDVAIVRTENANHYWLMSAINSSEYRYQIDLNASGTTRTRIARGILSEIKILKPPLPEQQKIATILSSVDTVIEKTRAQIDKLKDLKTGMMQELLTKGIGHTEFKDSPVGRIPAAWDIVRLGDVTKLERGRFSPRPRNDPQFYDGNIPFLQTGDISKEAPQITFFSQTLNEKGLKVSKLFPKGTLVITIAATIGEIGILEFDSCFPDSLVGIKVNHKKVRPMFILYFMRHLKSELKSLAPQTAQKNINLDILQSFQIPLPNTEEQELIASSMSSVDARVKVLLERLERTVHTKKALMQDLLTGKVRVNKKS